MNFQLGSPLLDGCVLAVLGHGDTYGYVLTQQIRQAVDISESTLYPVLRRLQKDGYLQVYDQSYQGRNRRYYTITDQGKAHFTAIADAWKRYCRNVDTIMFQGGNHD